MLILFNLTFILGAGASRESGCPLLADFLSTARGLHDDGKLKYSADDYVAVERIQGLLQRCNVKTQLDFNNIESVMSAMEMASIVGTPGNALSDDELSQAKQSIVRLISETLELTQRTTIRWSLTNDQIVPHEYIMPFYSDFVSLIQEALDARTDIRVCVITFNYDIGLELSLARAKVPYQYAHEVEANPDPTIRVLICKPHGSLNWVADGQRIIHWQIDPSSNSYEPTMHTKTQLRHNPQSMVNDERLFLVSSHLSKMSQTDLAAPFIVPPSDAKSSLRPKLGTTWRLAGQALAKSRAISIVGYSLPKTDRFFHEFLSLSLATDDMTNHISVIDPDGEAQNRIANVFNQKYLEYCYRWPLMRKASESVGALRHFCKDTKWLFGQWKPDPLKNYS